MSAFVDVFERAAGRFIRETPEGERTFVSFYSYLLGEFSDDPMSRDIVYGFLSGGPGSYDRLYEMARRRGGFDLFYPRIEGRVTWSSDYFRISGQREDFSRIVFDNDFLKSMILERNPDEIEAGELSGPGERGTRYMIIDRRNGLGYAAKHYQGGWFEKQVMLAFSGGIGSEIYSAGEHSFVEELMLALDMPNAPDIEYFTLNRLEPESAGTVIAHLFAAMHSCNVIFDAWNWMYEVRLKRSGEGDQPKILDFGSSYIWPHKDVFSTEPFGRDSQTTRSLFNRDLVYIARGLADIFPPEHAGRIARVFWENYHNLTQHYTYELAGIRENLASLESPY